MIKKLLSKLKKPKKTESAIVGRFGEKQSAKYLSKQGYKIIKRNYRFMHREIDIIAENKDALVFVEVKTRTNDPSNIARFGPPKAAVTKQKQKFLISAAYGYLRRHKCHKNIRFDVIEVYIAPDMIGKKPVVDSIHHIKNAFTVQ